VDSDYIGVSAAVVEEETDRIAQLEICVQTSENVLELGKLVIWTVWCIGPWAASPMKPLVDVAAPRIVCAMKADSSRYTPGGRGLPTATTYAMRRNCGSVGWACDEQVLMHIHRGRARGQAIDREHLS